MRSSCPTWCLPRVVTRKMSGCLIVSKISNSLQKRSEGKRYMLEIQKAWNLQNPQTLRQRCQLYPPLHPSSPSRDLTFDLWWTPSRSPQRRMLGWGSWPQERGVLPVHVAGLSLPPCQPDGHLLLGPYPVFCRLSFFPPSHNWLSSSLCWALVLGVVCEPSLLPFLDQDWCLTTPIGWPKNLFRFFCHISWKNPNKLFGQPRTLGENICTDMPPPGWEMDPPAPASWMLPWLNFCQPGRGT